MSSGRHANYLSVIFNQGSLRRKLRQARQALKGIEFDGLVARGTSGLVFASVLSVIMRKRLVVVRKPQDGSHSSYGVENINKGDKLIFVDDCVCSGNTLRKIGEAILAETNYDCSFVGGVLYGTSDWGDVTFMEADNVTRVSEIQILKDKKLQEEEERAKIQRRMREEIRTRPPVNNDAEVPSIWTTRKEDIQDNLQVIMGATSGKSLAFPKGGNELVYAPEMFLEYDARPTKDLYKKR